jgi:hypothetical protein
MRAPLFIDIILLIFITMLRFIRHYCFRHAAAAMPVDISLIINFRHARLLLLFAIS